VPGWLSIRNERFADILPERRDALIDDLLIIKRNLLACRPAPRAKLSTMQTIRESRPPGRIARTAVLGALGAALLAAGCSRTSSAADRGAAAIPVQIGKATLQTLPITQNSIGSVQSLRTVTVKSQVDGVIAAVIFARVTRCRPETC